ncbi:hypothetical protein [Comamonas sp. JC664]|uniref:hypothetical protein n=1 Tax=Comamonas sp. JC664 TaxID=2801917 RepID=UPI00174A6B0D|nr:hypothetical protein [Comamonas sp. JC664]MBL0694350.1 hypothetical protein [Comamonas sp. JC664]GHG77128.1 hypothetical protein GCM10012319_26830 [Comamonas sp. KCTC 72670]
MKVVNKLLEKLPEVVAEKIPDVKLQDQDIKVTVAQGALTAEKVLPPKLAMHGITLSFETHGEATVRNFNSPGDVDENGIVGETAAESSELGPRPQLLLGTETGWMRYQVAARVKAAVSASLSFLASEQQTELSVVLSDYRAHPLGRNMREAALTDLSELRLMQATDLAKLGLGDAVAWQARGSLQTRLELNWADVFPSNLNRLGFLRGSELLALKTSVKAGLSARVSLTDDYQLSFTRPRTGRIQVAVRKVKSHEQTLSAGLGIQVELLDPAAMKAQLGQLLEALLGPVLRELLKKGQSALELMDGLVEKASKAKFDENQKRVLGMVLERLGIDPQLSDPANLPQAWADFKARVAEALENAVRSHIADGFQYEYLRLNEASTLLEVVVEDVTAMRFHESLLKGNLVELLKWMKTSAQPSEFELRNYLHSTTLTRQQAVGFSLGFGSFELLKSRDVKRQAWVTQENFQGARRMAFLGRRGYEDKLLGNRGQWAVDLKADMTRFAPAPVATDFDYGLHLLQWGRQKKLTRKELQMAVDDAVVWGVLDTKDAASVVSWMQEDAGKHPIETRLEVKLADDTFRALVPRIQEFDLARFSRALARAMPWSDQTARASPEFRRAVYAPIWEAYLREVQSQGSLMLNDLSPSRAAQIAKAFFQRDATVRELGKDLQLIESEWRPGGGNFTFAEIIHKNPNSLVRCREFVSGMVRLRRAIDERKAPDELRTVFGELEGMWSTGFHLRAGAALLAEVAQSTPMGLAGVERTLTVRVADSEEQLVFSTTRGTGNPGAP